MDRKIITYLAIVVVLLVVYYTTLYLYNRYNDNKKKRREARMRAESAPLQEINIQPYPTPYNSRRTALIADKQAIHAERDTVS